MEYKALFIDWDGTLSNSRFWERWKDDSKNSRNYELLQSALFTSKEGEDLLIKWMVGQKSYDDVLGFLSKATGIGFDELVEELKYSAENMIFIDKDAPNLIQKIRAKGIKVIIAKDNMDTFRKWTVPALSLTQMFDDILASDALGTLKSEIQSGNGSKFFHAYLAQHNIQPSETALIDNSLNNEIVEQYGIKFLYVSDSMSATDYLKRVLYEQSKRH